MLVEYNVECWICGKGFRVVASRQPDTILCASCDSRFEAEVIRVVSRVREFPKPTTRRKHG